MSIFSKSNLPESDLKRNTFDLSFQNNLTTNFGVLKPVFCKEVLPGDTFDIDVTFGLRFMPTVFPIQNRARASVKFFYVRNRSLYEDFKEWSTGNDENLAGLPYLSDSMSYEDKAEFLKFGGLADSFGLPVSRTVPTLDAQDYFATTSLWFGTSAAAVPDTFYKLDLVPYYQTTYNNLSFADPANVDLSNLKLSDFVTREYSLGTKTVTYHVPWRYHTLSTAVPSWTQASSGGLIHLTALSANLGSTIDPVAAIISPLLIGTSSGLTVNNRQCLDFCKKNVGITVDFPSLNNFISAPSSGPAYVTSDSAHAYTDEYFSTLFSKGAIIYPVIFASPSSAGSSPSSYNSPAILSIGDPITSASQRPTITIPDCDYDSLPPIPEDDSGIPPMSNWSPVPAFGLMVVFPNTEQISCSDSPKTISLASLLKPAGTVKYGEVFQSTDLSNYFYYALYDDWEVAIEDGANYLYFTAGIPYVQSVRLPLSNIPWWNSTNKISAMPFRAYEMIYNAFYRDERNNPFQIDGVSYYDKFLPSTLGGADSNVYTLHRVNWEQDQFTTALPSPQQGTAPLVGISSTGKATLVDTDGQLVDVQLETADDGDTVVSYSQTSDLSPAVQRTLVNAASSGISINDFRAVNALQRYLEKNLRQGLRYKDMIQSRWGVSPSYSELNMPEFIGGVVEDVVPSQVNNNNASSDSEPLGSYAGQLYCQGSSKHKIHKFCDEPGYIIGILDVTPVPVYNSLLPKHFRKFDVLDFFNPEFGHIGYQPVTVGELCPNSLIQYNGRTMNSTFGYQRSWYDYLCSNDEIHGDFRGSLRDFVIYRDFVNTPSLSEEFLTVSDADTNNIFSVQTDADGNEIDKILGQLYFDVKAKRPIPRFGIPRLE